MINQTEKYLLINRYHMYIVMTKEEADAIRGNYGSYSAIDPIYLPDGTYFVPERCMSDPDLSDAKPALQEVSGNTITIEELPSEGLPCVSGQTYHYNVGVDMGYSEFVICRQNHNRTIYEPWETPALFTFTRENSDTLDWIPNEYVYLGWKRVYSGQTYEVIMEHMTQVDWTPPQTLGVLWKTVVVPGGEWQAGVAYVVTDEVTYLGNTYKCLQSHTSQTGWEPPNVPALWELIS
jgi:hypothetical protein